jgi:hypothetical protein
VAEVDTPETPAPEADPARPAGGASAPLAAAGLASLGAGAIHAAAAGAHGDPRQLAIAFAALAAAQLGAGALAVWRAHRPVAALVALVNAVAVGGWAVANSSGIGFVDGLEEAHGAQFADSAAAGLAAVAVVGAVLALGSAAGRPAPGRPRPFVAGVAGVAALALAVPGMVQAGGHSDGHAHGGEMAGHAHGDEDAGGHEHAASTTPPEPYDATLPVDLGGVPGVAPDEQAYAEAMVTRTIEDLPRWADYRDAEAAGWRSIGDGLTGHEHFINWETIDDDRFFDPNEPESLVYETHPDGTKTLAAAMYMLPTSVSLDDVPDDGGELIQYHIHDNLCYTDDPEQPLVRGITNAEGECTPPLVKHDPAPMVHVWVQPHECGPFASLEGVGAGQVAAGEERACDHAHGAT